MNKTKFENKNITDPILIDLQIKRCRIYEGISMFSGLLFLILSLFWIEMILIAICFLILQISWAIDKRYWCMKYFLINRDIKKK